MSDQLRSKNGASGVRTSYNQHSTTKSSGIIRQKSNSGNTKSSRYSKPESMGALEDLVQCPVCQERLTEPKTLKCEHTFCLVCIESKAKKSEGIVECPTCGEKTEFLDFDELKPNLYIESILKALLNNGPVENTVKRCVKCQTVCKFHETICSHCKLVFCMLCWPEHANDLEEKFLEFQLQLANLQERLKNKSEEYERKCFQLRETIKMGTAEKIAELKILETNLLGEVKSLIAEGATVTEAVSTKINDLSIEIGNAKPNSDGDKVDLYMQYHKGISNLSNEISRFGENGKFFDKANFKLDYVDNNTTDEDTLENEESYKSRSFTPKLIWTKCPKPSGIGVPPWDPDLVYITTLESKIVLILDHVRNKVIDRLTHTEMLCPHSVAFNQSTKEIFVSDKWKHCIHVFDENGHYLRFLCTRGKGEGQVLNPRGLAITRKGELILCDSGNDRVSILEPTQGIQIGTLGALGAKTEFNMPADVSVFYDDHNQLRIVVADAGNHRIKVYNEKCVKIMEFGSLGKDKSQFKCIETVAVDPTGHIFVGDSGNSRIQVFDKHGNFVRNFGIKNNKLKAISGLFVTSKLDVIITDSKSKSLYIV